MVNNVSVTLLESTIEDALSNYVRDVHFYNGDKIMCYPIIDGYVQPVGQMLIQLRATRILSVELNDLAVELEIRCNVVNKSDVIDELGDESKCELLFGKIESTIIRSKLQFKSEVTIGQHFNVGGVDYVRKR